MFRTSASKALEQTESGAKYLLSKHAFACIDAEYLIFLDLKNNKYLALHVREARCIADTVLGWPLESDARAGGDSQRLKLLRSLMERGLLTTDRELGKEAALTRLEVPQHQLVAEGPEAEPRLSLTDVLGFFAAVTSAARFRYFSSIEQTVRVLRRRREVRQRDCAAPDNAVIARVISVFSRLRPLVFTARDACLFDCLALGQLLARHGVFPTWVFAVRAEPFGAHCWLQLGDVVLNDFVEQVRGFTPIMTV